MAAMASMLLLLTFLFSQVSIEADYVPSLTPEECPQHEEQNLSERTFENLEALRAVNATYFNKGSYLTYSFISVRQPLYVLRKEAFKAASNFTIFILKIQLRDKKIQVIEDTALDNLDCLKWLDLSHNTIYYFTKKVFLSLQSLQVLDLSYNSITNLHYPLFTATHNLTYLDFSFNKLTMVTAEVFKKPTALKYLNFSGNLLDYVDSDTLKPLQNLQVLNLSDNRLVSHQYHTWLHQQNITILDLSRNALKEFPPNLLRVMDKVIDLDLSNNKLTEMNATKLRKSFPSLTHLNLNRNSFNCKHLKDLLMELKHLKIPFDTGSSRGDAIYGLKCEPVRQAAVDRQKDLEEIYEFIHTQKQYFIAIATLCNIVLMSHFLYVLSPKKFLNTLRFIVFCRRRRLRYEEEPAPGEDPVIRDDDSFDSQNELEMPDIISPVTLGSTATPGPFGDPHLEYRPGQYFVYPDYSTPEVPPPRPPPQRQEPLEPQPGPSGLQRVPTSPRPPTRNSSSSSTSTLSTPAKKNRRNRRK